MVILCFIYCLLLTSQLRSLDFLLIRMIVLFSSHVAVILNTRDVSSLLRLCFRTHFLRVLFIQTIMSLLNWWSIHFYLHYFFSDFLLLLFFRNVVPLQDLVVFSSLHYSKIEQIGSEIKIPIDTLNRARTFPSPAYTFPKTTERTN